MRKYELLWILTALINFIPIEVKAQKKPVNIDFFAHVKSISSLKVDNGNIFFILRQADLSQDIYKRDLYQLIDDQAVRLTSSEHVSDYQLLDGNIILRESPKKVNNKNDLDNITVFKHMGSGYGEALEWLSLPYHINEIKWIDNSHFFFTAQYKLQVKSASISDSLKAKDELACYRIFDELPFWGNGRGDISGKRSLLYYYDNGNIHLLTDSLSSVSELSISPDKHQLAYTLTKYTNKRDDFSHLFVVDRIHLTPRELIIADSVSYGQLNYITNQDLSVSIYHRDKVHPQENASLQEINTETGIHDELINGDRYELGNSLLSDMKDSNHSDILFDPSGFTYISTDIDYAPLVYTARKKRTVSILTPSNYDVDEFVAYKKGFLLIATKDQQGQEIYYLDKKGNISQLSNINNRTYDTYNVISPQLIKFTNRKGVELRGYVL